MAETPSYSKGYLYGLVSTAALGAFYFGYEMGVMNPLQFYLELDIYHWDDKSASFYIGMLSAFLPLGAIPGAFFSGKIAAYFGRRYACMICDAIAMVGLVLTLVVNLPTMAIGRFICGISVGINSVLVPLYINEISPIHIKGVMGAANQIFICLGVLLAYIMFMGCPIHLLDM
jgi:MFS family permease